MDSQYANKALVDIIVGGTFQDYARVSRAHVVAVFDNQQEVSTIPDQPNLIKIPLGGDDTVLSMLTRLAPPRLTRNPCWRSISSAPISTWARAWRRTPAWVSASSRISTCAANSNPSLKRCTSASWKR